MIVLPPALDQVAVRVQDPPALVRFPRGQHEPRLALAGARDLPVDCVHATAEHDPGAVLAGALAIHTRAPDAELAKNQVGNLAIMRDGEIIGWAGPAVRRSALR